MNFNDWLIYYGAGFEYFMQSIVIGNLSSIGIFPPTYSKFDNCTSSQVKLHFRPSNHQLTPVNIQIQYSYFYSNGRQHIWIRNGIK
jgi:hypothetical protein